MKMKKILKMPLRRMPRRPPPAESLHAKAAANAETYDQEDYDDRGAEHEVFARPDGCPSAPCHRCRRHLRLQLNQGRTKLLYKGLNQG